MTLNLNRDANFADMTPGRTSQHEEQFTRFREKIARQDFPCLGAKAALRQGTLQLKAYECMLNGASVQSLARDLEAFVQDNAETPSEFAVLAAVDPAARMPDEIHFEKALFDVLQRLHQIDPGTWDQRVSTDPANSAFKFSFAGRAFYVVGVHPQASRIARRFALPALIFNPVWQFDVLRSRKHLERLIRLVRNRDTALQGGINPNLRYEGILSDAAQYSGRAIEEGWTCPFAHREAAPERESRT
ncbi:guanitoxin biosynthesis heme-dependent pre-guanitoxin N-hydroxylase GntA [Nucisporomicrobium flavum]|uniref:guanitoxin biosynthesis heme-dependent pre-guanitoxin N-hydroxylase GntA n=1 Tax=Nucisporomicrobium flavum TaxID=2785915 RepID=UPI0018F64DEB|nr:guanitoxin biosynthesis heme-dependent pre-guanitoxin N-hydroxylase GntA [Nucisporomicrobium flavum]